MSRRMARAQQLEGQAKTKPLFVYCHSNNLTPSSLYCHQLTTDPVVPEDCGDMDIGLRNTFRRAEADLDRFLASVSNPPVDAISFDGDNHDEYGDNSTFVTEDGTAAIGELQRNLSYAEDEFEMDCFLREQQQMQQELHAIPGMNIKYVEQYIQSLPFKYQAKERRRLLQRQEKNRARTMPDSMMYSTPSSSSSSSPIPPLATSTTSSSLSYQTPSSPLQLSPPKELSSSRGAGVVSNTSKRTTMTMTMERSHKPSNTVALITRCVKEAKHAVGELIGEI